MTQPEIIELLEQHIADNCKDLDMTQLFRDMLDELYSFDSVGGPFKHMSPSRVLEEVDPIAFRCGINDHFDSDTHVEIGDNTYDLCDVEEQRQLFIEDLETELWALEKELAELQSKYEEGMDQIEDVASKQSEIESMKAKIKLCQSHSW